MNSCCSFFVCILFFHSKICEHLHKVCRCDGVRIHDWLEHPATYGCLLGWSRTSHTMRPASLQLSKKISSFFIFSSEVIATLFVCSKCKSLRAINSCVIVVPLEVRVRRIIHPYMHQRFRHPVDRNTYFMFITTFRSRN